jgi:hypothetical protein
MSSLLDAAGRRRSPATLPGYHAGRPPRNKGMRYPADPPTVEEIIAVMRETSDDRHGARLRAMIVVLWRAGLRIQEALALAEHDLDQRRGSLLAEQNRCPLLVASKGSRHSRHTAGCAPASLPCRGAEAPSTSRPVAAAAVASTRRGSPTRPRPISRDAPGQRRSASTGSSAPSPSGAGSSSARAAGVPPVPTRRRSTCRRCAPPTGSGRNGPKRSPRLP